MMRKLVPLIFFSLAVSVLATAQVPTRGNIFFGYSYAHTDTGTSTNGNLNGWNGSLEGKFLPFIGLVTDISGHYGSQQFPLACLAIAGSPCNTNLDTSAHTVLFGPRISATVGRITPFAHALFGVSHIRAETGGFSTTDTSFASAYGGGLDYRFAGPLAWRVQGDVLRTGFFGDHQNNFRFSTGIVLRF